MPGESPRRAETIIVLLLVLSATTGLVDAVSVLGLGKVFTANMTGNVVFLGFSLASAPGFRWPPYVLALAAFSLGAFAGGGLAEACATHRRRWLLTAACIEAALLAAAALVGALAGPVQSNVDPLAVLSMIALTAVAMGVRNATVRALKAPDLTTTVLTLTITGLAADVWGGRQKRPAVWRRLTAVAAMLAGALLGAALFLRFGVAVPLLTAAGIILAATVALAQEQAPAAG